MLCKWLPAQSKFQVFLFGTFWNFFIPKYFESWLVESSDVEPWIQSGRLTVLFKDFPLS